jgi:cytochrome c-type biogenesis protein CcmH
MGYLITAAFAVMIMLALYASKRCSRAALELAGAAILLGVAGYVWQGHPGMAGNPVHHPQR